MRGPRNDRRPDAQVRAQLSGGTRERGTQRDLWNFDPGCAATPVSASTSSIRSRADLAAAKTRGVHQHDGKTVGGASQGATAHSADSGRNEIQQPPHLVRLDRRRQRIRTMPPERPALRQEASALAAPAVAAEPINHHRPVDLGVVRAVAQPAAPAGEARCVEVGVPGPGEVSPQRRSTYSSSRMAAPEGAPARDERLQGSIEALQR